MTNGSNIPEAGSANAARNVFNSQNGKVEIEGTEAFVRECISTTLAKDRVSANAPLYVLDKGLEHAWQWFMLHANQRMQAVNFFLVASAFLSAAYVNALRSPVVAAGVSVLGMVFSLSFFQFERRIQELIKAGERALYPSQQRLAELTGVAEFKICETVEVAKRPLTKYSVVIRTLYGVTGLGFFAGFVYAFHCFFNPDAGSLPIILYRNLIILAAVAVLCLGRRLIERDRAKANWFQDSVGLALVITGIFVLLASAIRLLR